MSIRRENNSQVVRLIYVFYRVITRNDQEGCRIYYWKCPLHKNISNHSNQSKLEQCFE